MNNPVSPTPGPGRRGTTRRGRGAAARGAGELPEASFADLDPESREQIEVMVARVSSELTERLPEVTRGMRAMLGEAIGELIEDNRLQDLLGGAIEGNVGTILHMLRHQIPMRHVEAPSAAVEHARRLAQKGVPVNALVRAYRLGQGYLVEECFAELTNDDADLRMSLIAFNEINVRTFAYIDWISQEVVTVYETERDQWVRNRDTVRVAHIKEMVTGRAGTDLVAAEAALGYRLRQYHVAVILWLEEDTTATDNLDRLESAVNALGAELCRGWTPLSCAADRSTVWAWVPRGADAADPDVPLIEAVLRSSRIEGVCVAVGGVASGMDGFRDSHLQAAEAQRVLLSGRDATRRVIGYREPGVSAAALLAHNLEQTQLLVRGVLGPLAADDAACARLRETLLAFLSCGSSYTATAQQHMMHKNSVKYRVERALALRGRPLGDDRIDVELALVACRWLRGSLFDAEAEA
jgi:sugar diacid utilization regulator